MAELSEEQVRDALSALIAEQINPYTLDAESLAYVEALVAKAAEGILQDPSRYYEAQINATLLGAEIRSGVQASAEPEARVRLELVEAALARVCPGLWPYC